MFELRNFTHLSTKWAHFKFDACYSSQKRWHGGNKGLKKARHFKKIQLGEHLATNSVNWHQVCNMISYTRDVLERQSLSEVKMGRGTPICKRVRKKSLWNTLKTTFLNIKLQRLCKSNHLQCITSKYSEKLEKSLCVRDKVEDLFWMPIVFGPSDGTASFIRMILSLTLLNGPRNTSRNPCR